MQKNIRASNQALLVDFSFAFEGVTEAETQNTAGRK